MSVDIEQELDKEITTFLNILQISFSDPKKVHLFGYISDEGRS